MNLENLKGTIRDIPDFPTKGIIFRDLTTMIKNGEALHLASEALRELYKDKGVTKCCTMTRPLPVALWLPVTSW